ncbi:MAG: endonuclease/exonuclease/phosphatase family protein [Balneola sp.]|nr:MAG: endonuclease/exonuclease/phosphatase family protein [Balneola sp.]
MKHFPKYLLALGLIPVLLGFLGRWNWVFDAFSHFRLYYVIYFAAIAVLLLVAKKWKSGFVALFLGAMLFYSSIKNLGPVPLSYYEEGIKIASINLLSSNDNYKEVGTFIRRGKFDVLVFQEFTPDWMEYLKDFEEDFPFMELDPSSGVFGMGVYSKFEIDSSIIIHSKSGNTFAKLVEIHGNGKELSIMNIHPPPPVSKELFDTRNAMFSAANDFLKSYDKPYVLIGDFNSTTFSPNFKRLTSELEVRDSRKDFGLLPTWNTYWSLISITIDHALVSNGLDVMHRRVGPNIGSDHLPVIIEVIGRDW